MSYVDDEYYLNIFKGKTISNDDLERELANASDDIDSMTYNRIKGVGFNKLSPFQQECIKKAVCKQAEFIYKYGEFISLPVTSYAIGKTSVNLSTSKINGISTTKSVMEDLSKTGLLCRSINYAT